MTQAILGWKKAIRPIVIMTGIAPNGSITKIQTKYTGELNRGWATISHTTRTFSVKNA